MKSTLLIVLTPILLSVTTCAFAADEEVVDEVARESQPMPEKSADEVARELANPNNSLASLTFRNQYRIYTGDLPNADDQGNYTLLFQPVFPFTLQDTPSGGKANLFIRPAIPLLVAQPVFDAGNADFDGKTALGDIGFDIGYGVTEKSGLLWAYGMIGLLPTASSNEVGGKQLRLGPTGMVAKFYEWGVVGFLPSHLWNVAGWSDRQFSLTTAQVFVTVLPGGGWNVSTIPIMTYDWVSGDKTVPLNLAVGKTTKMGSTPVKFQFEVNYYVQQSDAFGPKWMIALNVTPVVRNVVADWFGK